MQLAASEEGGVERCLCVWWSRRNQNANLIAFLPWYLICFAGIWPSVALFFTFFSTFKENSFSFESWWADFDPPTTTASDHLDPFGTQFQRTRKFMSNNEFAGGGKLFQQRAFWLSVDHLLFQLYRNGCNNLRPHSCRMLLLHFTCPVHSMDMLFFCEPFVFRSCPAN